MPASTLPTEQRPSAWSSHWLPLDRTPPREALGRRGLGASADVSGRCFFHAEIDSRPLLSYAGIDSRPLLSYAGIDSRPLLCWGTSQMGWWPSRAGYGPERTGFF